MSEDGPVTVCEGCGEVIEDDLHGPKVEWRQRFVSTGPMMDNEPAQWPGETPQCFHKGHAPRLSNRWRLPQD